VSLPSASPFFRSRAHKRPQRQGLLTLIPANRPSPFCLLPHRGRLHVRPFLPLLFSDIGASLCPSLRNNCPLQNPCTEKLTLHADEVDCVLSVNTGA
jgi:hypothetical protein